MSGLVGGELLGAGSVRLAGGDEGGGGTGTITLIESTDGTVVVTGGAGPVVDLSVGGVKSITSPDGSITVTNPTGPVAHIVTADKTPGIIAKFSGAVIASEGATSGFLADAGGDLSLTVSSQTDPQLYPTAARTFSVLRVTAVGGTDTVGYLVTLYKNGAPTAQSVNVPAGTAAGAVLVDAGHPIAFAANDKFDLQWSTALPIPGSVAVSAVLEGPGAGVSGAGGIAGFSWLSTQLGRAAAMLSAGGGQPAIDTPWYTDLIIDPGKNIANQDIEFTAAVVASGTVTRILTKPGGVYLLDTGAAANSSAQIGTPNSGSFILENPVSGPFYLVTRCLAVLPVVINGSMNQQMIFAIDNGNSEAIIFEIAYGPAPIYVFAAATAAGNIQLTSPAVVDFNNAHDYAVGFDGVNFGCFIDGVPVPGLTTTNLIGLSSRTLRLVAQVANGGTASPVKMYVDKLACLQRSMQ